MDRDSICPCASCSRCREDGNHIGNARRLVELLLLQTSTQANSSYSTRPLSTRMHMTMCM